MDILKEDSNNITLNVGPVYTNILNKPEIQKIINTVQSNNRNTDYAIRYVVVKVSRLVKRDVEFFFSTEQEKIKLLNKKTYNEYPHMICKTLSELIRDILSNLGIKSKVVIASNTTVPLYALIVEGERGRYFIDALKDLFRTQYRIQPDSYGFYTKSNTNTLNYDELINLKLDFIREMDVDMRLNNGRIDNLPDNFYQKMNVDKQSYDGQYFSDLIDDIAHNFTTRNKAKQLFSPEEDSKDTKKILLNKIQYISEHLLNIFLVEGPKERAGLHSYLRYSLYNRPEKKNFRIGNKEHEPGNPVIIRIKYGKHILEFKEIREDTGENTVYSLIKTLEQNEPSTKNK